MTNVSHFIPVPVPPHESRTDPKCERHPRHQTTSSELTAQLCPPRHRHQESYWTGFFHLRFVGAELMDDGAIAR